ncbi:hypothetical protein [Nocardia blacklockiae]|nr:hypothetical protein [Nocardia blacklockiae]MBF6170982.1 hypothetical protein [Nocardia blacklockiae]
MKRMLFLLIAIIVAISTLDYGRSAGHYGLLIVGGVVAVILAIDKFLE